MQYTENAQPVNTAVPHAFRVLDMDLQAWRATVRKLTLRETGELVRALVRAQGAKRPNREQRMLLAIFTRPQPEGEEEVAP